MSWKTNLKSHLTLVVAVGLCAVTANAVNITLSDEGLMSLDWHANSKVKTATILEKRDIEGLGVEFDIYFPSNESPDNSLSYFSSKRGGEGTLVGIDVSMYDAFELKYTLVSVDGNDSPSFEGILVVGAYFNNAYRPEGIGFKEGRSSTKTSTTRIGADKIKRIGIHAHMLTGEGWNRSGTTITLLVEPVPGAVAIPESAVATTEPADTKHYYVDASATGSNDGSSWANAYRHLQDALAIASKDDEIWVAQGIYRPDQGKSVKQGDRKASFQLKNGMSIYGGFPSGGGRWEDSAPSAYQTILSGDLNGNDSPTTATTGLLKDPTRAENSYHVVTGSGTDETTVLDGFIITAGNANGTNKSNENRGGGMYSKAGSPTLINCIFKENSGIFGGGMNNTKGNPALTNCTFIGNYTSNKGGGMHSSKTSPILTNCIFGKNEARESGGGMYNEYGSPVLTNCTFSKNSAYAGGGIYNHKSKPILTNCILWGNSSRHGNNEPAQIYGVEATVDFCCIQGLTDELRGTDNVGLDPLFTNVNDNNYRLLANSPCIDSGDDTAIPSSIVSDADSKVRIIDGNGDGNTTVDMGAYEYQR